MKIHASLFRGAAEGVGCLRSRQRVFSRCVVLEELPHFVPQFFVFTTDRVHESTATGRWSVQCIGKDLIGLIS